MVPAWPGRQLIDRIRGVLADGVIDDEERTDLLVFLEATVGGSGPARFDAPTSLPLSRPPPVVMYPGMCFCLTGTFVFGPRRLVEAKIQGEGGKCTPYVVRANYLVIGATVTPAWKFGTQGLRIEAAVEMVAARRPIAIISEQYWGTTLT